MRGSNESRADENFEPLVDTVSVPEILYRYRPGAGGCDALSAAGADGADPIGACGHEDWTASPGSSNAMPCPDGTRRGGGGLVCPAPGGAPGTATSPGAACLTPNTMFAW